jgi:hypothetical protein
MSRDAATLAIGLGGRCPCLESVVARSLPEVHDKVRSLGLAGRGRVIARQRGAIGQGRPLAAEKRRPEIVEIRERGGHVDGTSRRALEAGALHQATQRFRLADRKTAAFIEIAGSRIESNRRVPKNDASSASRPHSPRRKARPCLPAAPRGQAIQNLPMH